MSMTETDSMGLSLALALGAASAMSNGKYQGKLCL